MRSISARVRAQVWLAIGLAAGVSLVPVALAAQDRQLDWPAIHVTARLDADGRLHVQEEQVMRLSGDWNGGERAFNLRAGQELELGRITRRDVAGAARELVEGNLDAVDHFDWAGSSTLRWRSRLPSDPPFDDTRITYTLEYVLSNILRFQGDSAFVLDHDFAFSDRVGMIDTLTVELSLDPIWSAGPLFTGRFSTSALPPGEGYVVMVPITYLGTAVPAGVRYGADESTRDTLVAVFTLAFLLLVARLLAREHRLGRFIPLPDEREITADFLAHNVFSRLPEVVGAAWDDTTSAPEVAATLARLVAEKKLSSRVEEKRLWIFNRSVLHLEMQVPRDSFKSHERALIDGLFRSNETKTDTERVRKRYKTSGFDPAALIKQRLEKLVEDTTPGSKGSKPSVRLTLLLLAIGALVMAWRATQDGIDAQVGIITVLASLGVYVVAVSQSAVWRSRVRAVAVHALRFLIPLTLGAYLFARVVYEGRGDLGAWMLVGLTVWMVGLVNSVLNQARSRQSLERIALRKRLAAAREFFRRELGKERPALVDDWFPYLIGFGLGSHIDKWFRAFGGAASSSAMTGAAMASSSSSSGGGSSWTGFGGGGGFSGGGSSASFAAAVGGIAASVPSPSSSGSGGGGGGGGGGSSGGGGGGGW